MKKLLVLFAVLALTAPMFAQTVTLTVTDEGNGVARVDYNATSAGAIVAGLGFTVTLDHGIISAINNYQTTGVNDATHKGYGIFPGSVDIDSGGNVITWGTPIDLTNAAGTGIGYSSMHIAMGTLYEAGNEPALTGTLFKFTVDCQGSTSNIAVSIAGDEERAGSPGGVVFINGTNGAISSTGGTIICLICPKNGTPAQQARWIAWNKPAKWCGDCWLCGDVTGDCQVTFSDVMQVFTYRSQGNGNGDVNMDGQVTFSDVMQVFTLRSAGGCAKVGAGCTPCTPLP